MSTQQTRTKNQAPENLGIFLFDCFSNSNFLSQCQSGLLNERLKKAKKICNKPLLTPALTADLGFKTGREQYLEGYCPCLVTDLFGLGGTRFAQG